ASTRGERETRELQVFFAPVPGAEEVVAILRKEYPLPANRPTYDVFRRSLIAKYGIPTLWGQDFPAQFRWSYDSNGMVRTPGAIKLSDCNGLSHSLVGSQSHPVLAGLPAIPQFEQLSARCGAIFIEVILLLEGSK